jgi:hypothetical protein
MRVVVEEAHVLQINTLRRTYSFDARSWNRWREGEEL